jgi:hypothetical protein
VKATLNFSRRLAWHLASRDRRDKSLPHDILCYWFPGLLWLMNDKQGAAALEEYTKEYTEREGITKGAYQMARRHLGLKGYRGHVCSPPVLEYNAVKGTYKVRAK